jgi:hypothetical protein
VLVLLMGGIYEVSNSGGFRWHDIHTFYDHRFKYSTNIKVIAQTV